MILHRVFFSLVSNCRLFLFNQIYFKTTSNMKEENELSFGRKVSETKQLFKLNVTGTLDAEMLEKHYCGVPDVPRAEKYKWSTNKLTYRYQSNVEF